MCWLVGDFGFVFVLGHESILNFIRFFLFPVGVIMCALLN